MDDLEFRQRADSLYAGHPLSSLISQVDMQYLCVSWYAISLAFRYLIAGTLKDIFYYSIDNFANLNDIDQT